MKVMYKQLISILFKLCLVLSIAGCVETPNITVSIPGKFTAKDSTQNLAPQLDSISNQVVPSLTSITTIDAGENGLDVDRDGDALTYSCFYDLVVNGSVSSTLSCSSLTGVSFSTSTGIMNWTPTGAQLGAYEFKIVASDGSLSDERIFTISVNNNNHAPVLDSIADQTVNEGIAITTINAGESAADVDSDGDVLTYTCYYDSNINGSVTATNSCTTLSGVSFNTSTGVMNWTPNMSQAGTYEFMITATDGSLSDNKVFSITVNNVNRAPVLDSIANQTVNEGIAITTINAGVGGADVDVDGDSLTYTCYYDTNVNGSVATTNACTSLTGITFNTSTGVMNWMPDLSQSGTYEFMITATDGSLSDNEIFTITITNSNQAPVLDSIADQTVSEGIAITTVNAGMNGADVDSDGETLTYTCHYDTNINGSVSTTTACTSLTGVSFNTSTGVMNWMPNMSQAGTYEFMITATDGSLSDTEIFSITVNNVNQAPVIDSIADQTVGEGSAIATINAADGGDDFDADGDAITYSCYYDTTVDGAVASVASCSTISGVSFNASTGVMNWTPSYTQSGNYEFKIVGSDSSTSGFEIFAITVTNTNQAPSLASISNQTVNENVAITTINANDGGDDFDADGDAITYSCYFDTTYDSTVATTNACSTLTGVTFTASTGVMNWTPDYSQAGNYEFIIIGSDGSLTGQSIFRITVNDVNRAPSLDAISNQTIMANEAMTTVNAGDGGDDFDIDGDALTYSCYYDNTVDGAVASTTACTSLSGVTFSTSTGVMNWTPTIIQASTYEFKIVAQDAALSSTRVFTVTVNTKVPFGFVLRIATGNTIIRLPLDNAGTYNFVVNYGDGTPLREVTSSIDTDATHTYTSAGDYTVSITGLATKISANDSNFRTSLYKVITLGDTGVTDLYYAFGNCTNLIEFAGGDTSAVTNMNSMFRGAANLVTADLSTFNTANVTDMGYMFYSNVKLANLNISNFNTAKVTNMSNMFYSTGALPSLDLSHFNTGKVTDMTSMFYLSGIATLDVSNFNTSLVTNMNSMFSYLSNVTSLNLSSFNTSNVTDMAAMFSGSSKLADIDLPNFSTGNVTTMNNMFSATPELLSLDLSHFNTSKVTNMANMFNGTTKLNYLDISNFNTANVTNMTGMFGQARALTSLNVSSFNTAKVTSMNTMFAGMLVLTSLDLSNFDTSNVTDMTSMFHNALSMTSLNISSFNTSKVTSMSNMFFWSKVSNLNVSHFDTSNVVNMGNMFYAANITNLNVSNFNTSKVTSMGGMFFQLVGTPTLNLSNFDTSLVTNMTGMFQNASSITTINATNWNISAVTASTNIFTATNAGLIVRCNQGGSPATGTLFGKTCQ